MFMGEFHHNLDSKGRLIIPARLRTQIGDKMVFTRGMEGRSEERRVGKGCRSRW